MKLLIHKIRQKIRKSLGVSETGPVLNSVFNLMGNYLKDYNGDIDSFVFDRSEKRLSIVFNDYWSDTYPENPGLKMIFNNVLEYKSKILDEEYFKNPVLVENAVGFDQYQDGYYFLQTDRRKILFRSDKPEISEMESGFG